MLDKPRSSGADGFKQYVLLLSPLDPEEKKKIRRHKYIRDYGHIGDAIRYKTKQGIGFASMMP